METAEIQLSQFFKRMAHNSCTKFHYAPNYTPFKDVQYSIFESYRTEQLYLSVEPLATIYSIYK